VLERLVEELAAEPPGRPLVLISDTNVGPLHAVPLRRSLERRGLSAELLTFAAGESSKSRRTKAELEDRLFDLGVGRDAALVAVGGGVSGDLAGFVAATWNRGIPVVQVPTSLLAMVDAALGGKTAINLVGGKNLIGAFHQPWGVYADVAVLDTLPETDYRDGFAELVKSAAIADFDLFRWLESSLDGLLKRRAEALERAVSSCMSIKGRIVKRDEQELGRRAVLNFGHTVAHALEAASGFELRHGPAVSVGLCAEGRLAVQQSGFPASHLARLEAVLAGCGLPTRLPSGLSIDAVVEATHRDKKVRAGRARYALPRRLGRMSAGDQVAVEIPEARLRPVLEALSGA
jgi:3-dehydroquinate synthase